VYPHRPLAAQLETVRLAWSRLCRAVADLRSAVWTGTNAYKARGAGFDRTGRRDDG